MDKISLLLITFILIGKFHLKAGNNYEDISIRSLVAYETMNYKCVGFQIDFLFFNNEDGKKLNINQKDFGAFYLVWAFFKFNIFFITPNMEKENRYLYIKTMDSSYFTVINTDLSIILNGQLIDGRKSKRKILCPLQIGKEIPIKYFEKISKNEAYSRYNIKVSKRGAIVIET